MDIHRTKYHEAAPSGTKYAIVFPITEKRRAFFGPDIRKTCPHLMDFASFVKFAPTDHILPDMGYGSKTIPHDSKILRHIVGNPIQSLLCLIRSSDKIATLIQFLRTRSVREKINDVSSTGGR